MTPFVLFNMLIAISTVVWGVVAIVYIYPALRRKAWHEAVLPLVLLHAFRFATMIGFGPGQMQTDLPAEAQAAADGMAWGDLTASLVALTAAVALARPQTRKRWVVWVFFAVALGDNVVAFARAASVNLFQYELGFNAHITVLYVPILLISYVLIARLMKHATDATSDGR